MLGRYAIAVAGALFSLLALTAVSSAVAEEANPWMEKMARGRPRLDDHGNPVFEMTNVRYGRIFLRHPQGEDFTAAMFEETFTVFPPDMEIPFGITNLSVWMYDERHPENLKKLYEIKEECYGGRFVVGDNIPMFYQLMCDLDLTERRIYSVNNGRLVAKSDYEPAYLEIDNSAPQEILWVTIRLAGAESRREGHPPYPVAELTLMAGDERLDRIALFHDDFAYAQEMASKADSSHGMAFVDIKAANLIAKSVRLEDFWRVRLVYSVHSSPDQQFIVPVTMKRLEIEKVSLPKGFRFVRLPPTKE